MEYTKNSTTYVDLITGFFGAGKTEFLNQYAAFLKRQGTGFVVIKNEFGPPNMDTPIYEAQGITVKEISGG